MTLEVIKSQTTWNDAASSINSNFAKLLQAILSSEGSGGGTGGIDETQLAEYLINNGYTTEDWVKLQKYLKETDAAELYATIDSVEEIGGRVEALEKLNIKDMFYCVKNEDGEIVSIGTKYDFFSEGEISANGMNAGSGGGGSTGGGLITSVLGKSAFGSVASEDNSTTFNAFAIDSLYKRLVALEGKNVDLSGYYTSAQTDSAIAAALVPYIKTTDADVKYASLLSFNALKSSFDALNSALNDDVSGKINTWNEIVDFLNEYSGSQDLATILSGMNSDIASRLKTSDFETWKANSFNPLVDRVTTAERNITKNTNAINSINSHMQGVDGTITAIQKQTDGINQRVETLETWKTATDKTITSLSSQVSTNTINIDTNRQNIERIFSWFSEDADGNVFTTRNFYSTLEVSGNGLTNGTGGGGGSYPRLDSWANYDPAAGAVLSAILGNDLRMRIESQGSRIFALEGASTSVSVSNLSSVGTRIATITINGVAHEVKGDFLQTSGGTIAGDFGILSIKRKDSYGQAIKFENSAQVLGYIGFNNSNKGIIYEGEATGASHFILHSGNIGNYAIRYDESTSDFYASPSKYNTVGYGNGMTSSGWHTIGPILTFGKSSYFAQLQKEYNNNSLYLRSFINGNFTDWKTIAFTDSNVASATKLATPRTIWGQSFDGTGDVDGYLHMSRLEVLHLDDSSLWLNYGAAYNGKSLRMCGNDVAIYYGKSSSFTRAITINSSGNVTIGGRDLAGTSANLWVENSAVFSGDIYIANGKSLLLAKDAEGIYIGDTGVFWHNAANIWTKTLMVFNGEGNVTIGGAAAFGSTLSVADHVTLTSGKRLKLAESNGIFLNNYGIHYQGASANDVNSIFSFSDSGYTTTIHSFFVNPASGVDVQLGNSEYPFYSLATKQIKAHTFYKVSEATNASGQAHQSKAGWYRIFTSRPTNAGSTPIRLFIARNYVSPHNESYVFDITVAYNGKINITQVSGINNADSDSLIDQIRVDWVNDNRFYIDFHKKVENKYSNQYMVWGIGDGEFQTPTRVSDTPVGTAYKFDTRRGFKQQGEAFFTTANPYSGNISAPTVVTIDAVDEYATALNVFGKIKLKNLVEFYYHSGNKAVRISHPLYSDGEISANGLSSSSDIRYKNRMNEVSLSLDAIANAPIFRYTWKHIEDGKVHLGTSAQYWLDTEAKELVSINNEDFHRLDYATLGVMMGVTLAKKAKSHEERIKELEMKVESLEAENRRLRYGN